MTEINMSFNQLSTIFNHDVERFLKDNQMMLSSTAAWGVLRRDLILALGVERAKRFLLRYGWHCGKNEARNFKDMFDWEDDVEWLTAGSKMHNIGGRVFSYPIKFDVDISNGLFDVSGYWIDSYEAKQHLEHFSPYHEPVCHFLVGYAGGYTSECLGKKIIFKETHCVGKGDKHCRYTGKTLEQWGEEITDDLINYEEQDINDELDRVYRRVEKQKEVLKVGSSISKNLTHALLQGKGLEDFCEILSEEIRKPVIIFNQYFECIAASTKEIEMDFQKVSKLVFHQSIEQTIQIELEEDHLLIAPIIIRKDIYGYICFSQNGTKFGEASYDFVERAATICAIQMLNERTAIETEERMKGELLEELFQLGADVSLIARKFSILGYNLKEPHYVFVFHFDEGKEIEVSFAQEQSPLKQTKDKLVSFIHREAEHHNCKVLTSVKLNNIKAIIPSSLMKKKKMDVTMFGKKCVDMVRKENEKDPVPIYVGISTASEGASTFYKKITEANKAIEVAKVKEITSRNGKVETVIDAKDLGHLLMLLDARNPEELKKYADEKLDILSTYDEKNEAELVKTLYFYMENECNLHKTSRVMNVSISGMRYRIQRIQELAGINLALASTRFEVQLALQIYLVFGLLKLS